MTTVPATAVADTELLERPLRGTPEDQDDAGRLIAVTVTAAEQLGPNLRRLTLASPGLRELTLTGPDEFFGLLMPRDRGEFTLFDTAGRNIRAAVAEIGEDERPGLRWYTVRHFRQEAGEIDVDVVMHDDHPGPGATWVAAAQPGDTAGIWLANAIWTRHNTDSPLFVADPSAVPALRAVLEFTVDHHPEDLKDYHLVIVTDGGTDLESGFAEEWQDKVASLTVLNATPEQATEAVRTHLTEATAAGHPSTKPGYVWASGEAGMAKAVRGVAVDDWGLDSSVINWVAYWIEGRPRP
ncbi:MAG TPA: siderophore-interacting protein [Candidatus Corynebacterium avicola]|uniref:Siderophore-interacting protein n=1 Tax=Candidatus Corynebacterium avicola TaxID=2838527 RepID=A0A9D1RPF2_9CORY|nr:siderophore-interacting protein [Candidatus Corynebacterium avicola]